MPGAYTSPNNNTNPLWNGTRAMSPTDVLPDEDVNDDVMEPVYSAANFGEFGGGAGYSGIPEGSPHGSVHVDVRRIAGRHGRVRHRGRDPIFYAHHSNVDKIWSDWNKGASSHENPTRRRVPESQLVVLRREQGLAVHQGIAAAESRDPASLQLRAVAVPGNPALHPRLDHRSAAVEVRSRRARRTASSATRS